MSACKTGAEHIKSLKDGRTVYIDGKLVPDVTEHPAFRNSIRSAASLYDFQARPENIELMTFKPDGSNRRVNRAWQIPRNHAEMVQRRKALQAWAELSCGFMGRSPDHLASALVGQRIGLDVFKKHSEARAKAFADYFEEASRNDYFLTYVIINPQAERGKDWGEQAHDLVAAIVDEDSTGITIRGAKMLGTSSIMANEVFVANLQPLKPGEERLAFSCALPMNTKGLRVLSRKSYEAHAVSVFDNPLSSRFDENDALMYFDDVKVPWERVFVYKDTDMCRAQFHDTAGHAYQNYQAQIRLSVKIKFLIGLAHRLTEVDRHQRHAADPRAARLPRGQCQHGAGDDGRHGGRGKHARRMVGAEQALHVFGAGADPGPLSARDQHAARAFRRRADHAAVLGAGLRRSALKKIIGLTQQSAKMKPEEKVKFLKLAWDAIGSEFGSRHTQYEMFYAGARFVTTGHSYRTFDWAGANGMVDKPMAGYDLPTSFPSRTSADKTTR